MSPALKELLFSTNQLRDPRQLPNIAAWFDSLDLASMVVDSANRVSLWADKSGNSNRLGFVNETASSNYMSTPDSAGISVVGDRRWEFEIEPDSWAVTQVLANHGWLDAGQKAWSIALLSSGVLELVWTQDGNTQKTADASAAVAFSAFTKKFVRIDIDVDNGASGSDVWFYTSDDEVTWTQVGAKVTVAGAGNIWNSTSALRVSQGTSGFLGRFYKAKFYSGLGTSLVAEFNPGRDGTRLASTVVSASTGETWTVNTSGATGARISGARDLYQGTLASQPVLLRWSGSHYGYLRNATADFFSTPDSSAASQTGDNFGWGKLTLIDWTPSARYPISSKDDNGTQRQFMFSLEADGTLQLRWWPTGAGASQITQKSTAATPFVDGATGYVGYTIDVDNGAAGYDLKFWTSTDGANWTQLGTTIVGVGTTSFFNSTYQFEVGTAHAGELSSLAGNIGRLVYGSGAVITGTPTVDFDPTRYVSGTTFVAATGETWTLNGGATIVTRTGLYRDGVDDNLVSAPFSLPQPMSVYWLGSAVSWTAADIFWCGNGTTIWLDQNPTSSPDMRLRSASNSGNTLSSLAVQTFGVLSSIINGAASFLRHNRNAAVTGNLETTAMNGLRFSRNNSTDFGNMLDSEIVIYSAAHGTSTQDRFALYAGRKWRAAV